MSSCPQCAELLKQRDEAFRVLEKVLAELQAMNAGADPKFRKFLRCLSDRTKRPRR